RSQRERRCGRAAQARPVGWNGYLAEGIVPSPLPSGLLHGKTTEVQMLDRDSTMRRICKIQAPQSQRSNTARLRESTVVTKRRAGLGDVLPFESRIVRRAF